MASVKAKEAEAALSQTTLETVLKSTDYLSTGVYLIDKCLGGGVVKGRIYRLLGRPSGGKTFVGKTILAEAANNPNFAGYWLVYDDIERGALMDDVKFFGQKAAERMRPPGWYAKTHRPYYSRTVLDFCNRMKKVMLEGKKVIWIVDSLDALEGDLKQTKMGDGKAKQYSQEIRRLVDPIEATGSVLVLTSQSRVDMDSHSFVQEDITAGGRALEHYPSGEIELRKIKSLRRPYKGVKYVTGSVIRARVKKNRISGKDYTVFFPFYPSYGIDDLGACVNYLLAVKHWKGPKKEGEPEDPVTADDDCGDEDKEDKIITAPEFKFNGKKSDLIRMIEEADLEPRLREVTGKTWDEIEKAITPERKGRYS